MAKSKIERELELPLAAKMLKYKLKVQPVCNMEAKIDWWTAGFIEVTIHGQNIVNVHEKGNSPEDAVNNLLRARSLRRK